jgi:hypothetical protein
LTNVTIPNGVARIGSNAFAYCFGLTNIAIPSSVINIGDWAFIGCNGLSAINVSIGNPAYSSVNGILFDKTQNTLIQCPQAKAGNFEVPESVTSIGRQAFDSCINLTGVFFHRNPPALGSSVFDGADNTTVYYLPGMTGWGTTFGGRPTALWGLPYPIILNDGPGFGVQTNGFSCTISWASNASVVVEACTNLANPLWFPLQTNTLNGGLFYFNDPQWKNHPARFYQVHSR